MRASGTRRGKHRGWPGVGGRAQPHLRADLGCDLGQAVTFEACFSHLSHAGRAGQSLGPMHPRAPTTQAREKPFLPSPSHGAPLTSAPVQVKSSGLKASSTHANMWKRKPMKGWEQLLATPLKAASAKQRLLMVRPGQPAITAPWTNCTARQSTRKTCGNSSIRTQKTVVRAPLPLHTFPPGQPVPDLLKGTPPAERGPGLRPRLKEALCRDPTGIGIFRDMHMQITKRGKQYFPGVASWGFPPC